jgi:hypothetical protein
MAALVQEPSPLIEEIKARVARFLREDFYEQDLTSTFLFLRQKARGVQAIKCVADLLAHQGEICKGYITDEVQAICDNLALSFHWQELNKGNHIPAPSRFLEGMESVLSRTSNLHFQKYLGISKAEANRLFPDLKRRLIEANMGRINTTNDEGRLLLFLHSTTAFRHIFTDQGLARDFQGALKSSGVADAKLSKRCATYLTLYALSKMHNTVVQVEGYPDNCLLVQQHDGICLQCYIQTPIEPDVEVRKSTKVVSPLFKTSLTAADYVEAGALQTAEGISLPVEVGPDLKLRGIA